MSDDVTVPEESPPSRREPRKAPTLLALAVAWCPEEPARVGEVLLVPGGSPRVFGRGDARPDDPAARLLLVRQRPGENVVGAPLALSKISRVQLRVRSTGERLVIERLGMCALLVDGVEVDRLEVGPGDLVQLGNQLLFVCVRRAAWFDEVSEGRVLQPFGDADDDGIVGESEAAWRLRESLDFVAHRAEHALVLGPSGSGKELVARAIHRRSSRAKGPLLARNAATIPEGIADAELFGNSRNYPNAGMPERAGLVGEVHGGTLFLDEFAELPLQVQSHLLRVLDDGEYQRLGEARTRVSDFRLVAATNRDTSALKHDVAARFRLRVDVPGLGDRLEDLPFIAAAILRRVAAADRAIAARLFPAGASQPPRLGRRLVRRLLRHPYTTHVRELEALLWEALRRGGPEVELADSQPRVRVVARRETPALERHTTEESEEAAASAPAEDLESELSPAHVQRVLDENNGSIEKTYRALGLSSRHALSRLIKRHGLELRRKPGA